MYYTIYIQTRIFCNICTEEGKRFCRNMSVKFKVVVLYLKIIVSLLLSRPFGNIKASVVNDNEF